MPGESEVVVISERPDVSTPKGQLLGTIYWGVRAIADMQEWVDSIDRNKPLNQAGENEREQAVGQLKSSVSLLGEAALELNRFGGAKELVNLL